MPVFYNDKNMLKIMLDSVLKQDYQDIEHVITDGGSTDGSIELLEEYERKYSECGKKLIWKSEKDKGIYDGVNKALYMSTGEYIMVGTDPYTDTNSISKICSIIEANNLDYVYGGLNYIRNGRIVRTWSGKKGNWRLGWMAANPTLCVRREIWLEDGPYDITYVSAADYKKQVQLFMNKSLVSDALPYPLVDFHAGGTSNGGIKANLLSIKENFRIMKDCKVPFGWFTVICKIFIAIFAYVFASHKKIDMEDKR